MSDKARISKDVTIGANAIVYDNVEIGDSVITEPGGADRHDVTQLEVVLDGRVVLPPEGTEQNLCADKGV